jgi:hypothetical protein
VPEDESPEQQRESTDHSEEGVRPAALDRQQEPEEDRSDPENDCGDCKPRRRYANGQEY